MLRYAMRRHDSIIVVARHIAAARQGHHSTARLCDIITAARRGLFVCLKMTRHFRRLNTSGTRRYFPDFSILATQLTKPSTRPAPVRGKWLGYDILMISTMRQHVARHLPHAKTRAYVTSIRSFLELA